MSTITITEDGRPPIRHVDRSITMEPKLKRAKELLRAAHDLLQKADDSPYVVDVMSTTVFYDEADCDGGCLRDDIAHWLEFEA
jgi:hypothetical protein